MKRIISLITALVISLSFVTANADEIGSGSKLKRDEIINYVVSSGISKSDNTDQNRAVTRGETAGMLGRAIGVADTATRVKFNDVDENDVNFREIAAMNELGIIMGSEGNFRPNDTITRQEFAVMLERIYKSYFDMFNTDEKYYDLIYTDMGQISDWALQSVINVSTTGIMTAREGKKFAPLEKVNFYELSYAAKNIYTTVSKKYVYTVSDTDTDPQKEFNIYQKGYEAIAGMSGFEMLARFNGAPGRIYVSRTTSKPAYEKTTGNAIDPVAFARIINPEGYVVARVNLNYIENGKMAKIINIPDGSAGIWQIQVVNGRDDDVIEVGINGASSWGVRGAPYFKTSETTPKEMYFWTPQKFTSANIASTSGFVIKDTDNNVVASPTDVNLTYAKKSVTTSNLKSDTVYKLCLSDMNKQTVCVRGVPKLMSPTAEMAMDLKGGYVYSEDGIQCHGALEAKARNAMLKLYDSRNGDFTVIEDRPEQKPRISSNKLAEAAGIQAIDTLYNTMANQCLIKESPFLGSFIGKDYLDGTKEMPTSCWETDFNNVYFSGTWHDAVYTINSELNYFYGDEALRDRITLYFLWAVSSLEDIHIMSDNQITIAGHHYYYTHSNFYLEYITKAYFDLHNYIEPEYNDIIKEGIEIMTDKMMQARGNGPSNQYTHGVISAMNMYLATGEERYHKFFKRGVRIATSYNGDKGYWENVGQAPAGYYIEQGGCDGNYEHMNCTFFSSFWEEYCKSEMADPETVDVIVDSINRMLKFHSLFEGHFINGLNTAYTSHYTSRTDSTMQNRGGQFSYSGLAADFPIARAMWNNSDSGATWGNLFPHLIADEESAESVINQIWDKGYGHYYDNSTRTGGGSPMYYKMLDRNKMVEPSALPCDSKHEIFSDNPGIAAISSNGVYTATFYNSTRANSAMANMSYYGGPSLVSSKNTAGVVSSVRHTSVTDEGGVVSSSVYGMTAEGNFYVSGKEALTFDWIEEGKKFRTYGSIPNTQKTLNWIYEMTDDGIVITAKVDGVKSGDDLWLNLPLTNQTAEGFEYKDEAGRVTMSYKGAQSIIEWDNKLEYKLLDTTDKISVKRLRIKFPSSGEISVKFTTEG